MSRCYPYEKKAYEEPPLSPKKEKHKQKDKKKKRRRDSEANGDPRPRDKDKRSKRDHRSERTQDQPSLATNGSLSEMTATTSAAVHEHTSQAFQASTSGEDMDSAPAISRKGLEPICLVDSKTTSIPFRAIGTSNGTVAKDLVRPLEAAFGIEDEMSRRRQVDLMAHHVENVWSAVDDQEWLFLRDDQLQLGSREREAGETPQVWAEAILLPSVGIYALPYVVSD